MLLLRTLDQALTCSDALRLQLNAISMCFSVFDVAWVRPSAVPTVFENGLSLFAQCMLI